MEKYLEFINGPEEGLSLIFKKSLQILLIGIFAFLIIKTVNIVVDKLLFQESANKRIHVNPKRAKTLATILKSITRYLMIFITAAMSLELFGVNTGPLLAAASLASLAIGFGAQNLVRDIITGFFILLEDQFNVGDYVTAAEVSGIVEDVGLRTTKLRDLDGSLHIIPNGRISMVTNHMGDKMRVLFNIHIPYEEDINKVFYILNKVFEKARLELPEIMEGPQILGVQDLNESGVCIAIFARTKPLTQWQIERELRQRITIAFSINGISVPYPRKYVIFRREVEKND